MKIICIELQCIRTNKTNLRYVLLHASVTQQIKLNCVTKVIRCNRKWDEKTCGVRVSCSGRFIRRGTSEICAKEF
jgi:hypothetical protein